MWSSTQQCTNSLITTTPQWPLSARIPPTAPSGKLYDDRGGKQHAPTWTVRARTACHRQSFPAQNAPSPTRCRPHLLTGQDTVLQTHPQEAPTIIFVLSQLSVKVDETAVSLAKLNDLQLENHKLKLKLAQLKDLKGTKQRLEEHSSERSLWAKPETMSTTIQAKQTLVQGSYFIWGLDEVLYTNTGFIAQSSA